MYAEKNHLKIKAHAEKYKEEINLKKRLHYHANPQANSKKNSEWRSKNIQKSLDSSKAWRTANSDRHKASVAVWQSKNVAARKIHKQNRRSREKQGGVLSIGIADKLFKLQKGKCACCKQPLGNNYHLDHIMPLALGGSNTDDNIQLLTAICNMQKHAKHPVDFMRSRGFLI